MTITLRLAQDSDIPLLEELIPLSARNLQAVYYSSAQIEGALGTVFGIDTQLILDGTYFVAEVNEQIVGCGGWSKRNTLFGSDRAKVASVDELLDPRKAPARIRAFFVHPNWSRRGIGKRMVQVSENAAIHAGFRVIELVATLAGEPLYSAFGYRAIKRFELPLPNGLFLPVVQMIKNLETNALPTQ